MSGDLSAFAKHCRAMVTAVHRPDCPGLDEARPWGPRDQKLCPDGCVADADRALWARFADEADAYLRLGVSQAG